MSPELIGASVCRRELPPTEAPSAIPQESTTLGELFRIDQATGAPAALELCEGQATQDWADSLTRDLPNP